MGDVEKLPAMICTLCNGLAEFCGDEGVFRHAGEPFEKGTMEQIFCDRYGYPIQVKERQC